MRRRRIYSKAAVPEMSGFAGWPKVSRGRNELPLPALRDLTRHFRLSSAKQEISPVLHHRPTFIEKVSSMIGRLRRIRDRVSERSLGQIARVTVLGGPITKAGSTSMRRCWPTGGVARKIAETEYFRHGHVTQRACSASVENKGTAKMEAPPILKKRYSLSAQRNAVLPKAATLSFSRKSAHCPIVRGRSPQSVPDDRPQLSEREASRSVDQHS